MSLNRCSTLSTLFVCWDVPAERGGGGGWDVEEEISGWVICDIDWLVVNMLSVMPANIVMSHRTY